ncbi:MAG: T9SS type A sorting domain-containing protein [Bacteroidetes bacterium]|nr:T9SS type A sorting domain-containing protein [Bacteroidota bacterium]
MILSSEINAQFTGIRTVDSTGTSATYVNKLLLSADSNLILLARSSDSIQPVFSSIMKADGNGSLLWQTHHVAAHNWWSHGVTLTDGSTIAALSTYGTNDTVCVAVSKFDSSGNLVWLKPFLFMSKTYLRGMCHGANNSVLLIGITDDPSWTMDYWTAQIDTAGNILSSHQYHFTNNSWTYTMVIDDFVSTQDGSIAFGKQYNTINNTYEDMILKFDQTGFLEWNRILSYQTQNDQPKPISVNESRAGDLYFYSYEKLPGTLGDNFYLTRTDSHGNLLKAKKFYFPHLQPCNFLINKNDELVILTNYSDYPTVGINVIVVDTNFNVLRSKYYPDYTATDVLELPDGRIAFSGYLAGATKTVIGIADSMFGLPCHSTLLNFTITDVIYNSSDSTYFNDVDTAISVSYSMLDYTAHFYDSLYCGTSLPLSVDEQNLAYLDLFYSEYPSPFISINSYDTDEVEVLVYSISGAIIYRIKNLHLTNGANKILLDNFSSSPGIYFVKIRGSKTNCSMKFANTMRHY